MWAREWTFSRWKGHTMVESGGFEFNITLSSQCNVSFYGTDYKNLNSDAFGW